MCRVFLIVFFTSSISKCLVCLTWVLSGWGSRLYSLVGGTAPCWGDNYTVYCLPWGAHWTIMDVQQNLFAGLFFSSFLDDIKTRLISYWSVCIYFITFISQTEAVTYFKYVHLSENTVFSNNFSKNHRNYGILKLFFTQQIHGSSESTWTTVEFADVWCPLVEL